MSILDQITMRYELLNSVLGEKQRRLFLAVEAKALGRGGISQVAKATGASRNTIAAGLAELEQTPAQHPASAQHPTPILGEEKKSGNGRGEGECP